jgi:hypothetical protein
MSALDRHRQAHQLIPIALNWKAHAETRIIDGSSQERGFPFTTIWRALSPYFFTTDSWLYVGSNGLRTRVAVSMSSRRLEQRCSRPSLFTLRLPGHCAAALYMAAWTGVNDDRILEEHLAPPCSA